MPFGWGYLSGTYGNQYLKIEDKEKELNTTIFCHGWFKYLGPQLHRAIIIPPGGFRIYHEEFGETYDKLRKRPQYDLEILKRAIDGVRDGIYENNYFFYHGLTAEHREKYSYDDILVLFNRLHWNCRIFLLETTETKIYNPWRLKTEKRVRERYKLRYELTSEYYLQINETFLMGLLDIINNEGDYPDMINLLKEFNYNFKKDN